MKIKKKMKMFFNCEYLCAKKENLMWVFWCQNSLGCVSVCECNGMNGNNICKKIKFIKKFSFIYDTTSPSHHQNANFRIKRENILWHFFNKNREINDDKV